MIGKNLFGETGEKPVRARRRETRDKLQIPFGRPAACGGPDRLLKWKSAITSA